MFCITAEKHFVQVFNNDADDKSHRYGMTINVVNIYRYYVETNGTNWGKSIFHCKLRV